MNRPFSAFARPPECFIPNPKLRFLDQCREVMRFKQFAQRTEESYVGWIRRFILWSGKRHPREMGTVEVRGFLTYLAVRRNVAAATQNRALNALRFFYTQVLERKLGLFGKFARASRPVRLPVGLTPAGVRSLLAEMTITHLLARRLVVVILWKIEVVFKCQRIV